MPIFFSLHNYFRWLKRLVLNLRVKWPRFRPYLLLNQVLLKLQLIFSLLLCICKKWKVVSRPAYFEILFFPFKLQNAEIRVLNQKLLYERTESLTFFSMLQSLHRDMQLNDDGTATLSIESVNQLNLLLRNTSSLLTEQITSPLKDTKDGVRAKSSRCSLEMAHVPTAAAASSPHRYI